MAWTENAGTGDYKYPDPQGGKSKKRSARGGKQKRPAGEEKNSAPLVRTGKGKVTDKRAVAEKEDTTPTTSASTTAPASNTTTGSFPSPKNERRTFSHLSSDTGPSYDPHFGDSASNESGPPVSEVDRRLEEYFSEPREPHKRFRPNEEQPDSDRNGGRGRGKF